jgi:hypothetical protein
VSIANTEDWDSIFTRQVPRSVDPVSVHEKAAVQIMKERIERLEAQQGTYFTKDELAILSKLLRGHIVGPAGRAVLYKVHGV